MTRKHQVHFKFGHRRPRASKPAARPKMSAREVRIQYEPRRVTGPGKIISMKSNQIT